MRVRESEFSGSNLNAETNAGLTVVLFWEPWDSVCRREWRIIKEAAGLMAGQLKIGKCSIEECPRLARQFNIRSIPTTLVLKNCKEAERLVGLRHAGTLIRHLKKHLEGKA